MPRADRVRTRANAQQRAPYDRLQAADDALQQAKPGTHEHAVRLHECALRYREIQGGLSSGGLLGYIRPADGDWVVADAWAATEGLLPELNFNGDHLEAIRAHDEEAYLEKHGCPRADVVTGIGGTE